MDRWLTKLYLLPGYLRYLFIFAICAIIAGVLYSQDILPLYDELTIAKNQQQQLTRTLQKLYYRETLLEEKMPQLPETNAVLKEWQKEFIKRSDVESLLKMIVRAGKKIGVDVTITNIAPVMPENHYLKQSFHILLQGNDANVVQFIKQMANLPWLVVVKGFNLTKPSQEILSAEVEWVIYYLS